ncbi:MAG: hypothetical protein ACRCWQ_09220 [Bacilli bacterium]
MKPYRTLLFTAVGVLSASFLFINMQSASTTFDRNFELKPTVGENASIKQFPMNAVVPGKSSGYEHVILNGADIDFVPTKFDLYNGVGEEVLKHKDFYRNFWSSSIFEDSTYLIGAGIGHKFPYEQPVPTSEIMVKNKKTGELVKNSVTLKHPGADYYLQSEQLLQNDKDLYYVVSYYHSYGKEPAKYDVYSLDTTTATLKHQYANEAKTKGYANFNNFTVINNTLYYIEQDDNNLSTLYALSLLSGDLKSHSLKELQKEDSSYIQRIESYNDGLLLFSMRNIYSWNISSQKLNHELTFADEREAHITDLKIQNATVGIIESGYEEDKEFSTVTLIDLKEKNVIYNSPLNINKSTGIVQPFSFQ